MAKPCSSISPAGDQTSLLSPLFYRSLLGGEEGQMNGTSAAARWTAPFTAAQWEELEQQALIYKYLVAGVPVPPDLLLPIRRSFDSMATRFYHYPSLGYGPYFGKKMDPEPGRCRRTDGKKWRCSKEAAPDSKYCERHMHRGRNRSRKPVETQPPPPPLQSPSASTVTSLAPAGTGGGGSFQTHHHHPLHSLAGGSNPVAPFVPGAGSSHLQMDAGAYASGSKDLRYAYGVRANVDEYNLFSEASGSLRGVGMDASLENSWRLMPSQISSFPLSTTSRGGAAALENNYTHFVPLNDLGPTTISSFQKPDCQQHSFFGSEFGAVESVVKQESQPLRPFFDEWPKARDSWPDLVDDNSNRTCFSATQLSISIPMASPDFSTTSSRSANDD